MADRCPACGNVAQKCIFCKTHFDHWGYLLTTKTGQQFELSDLQFIDNGWIYISESLETEIFDSAGPDVIHLISRGLMIHISAVAFIEDSYL